MPRKPKHLREQALEKRKHRIDIPQQEESDNMSWIHVFMVLSYFTSCFLLLEYFPKAVMDFSELLKLFCLIIGLAFLVPIKLYRKWFTMSMYEYIIFNFLGLATFFCTLFFILNDAFKAEPYEETYKITKFHRVEKAYIFTLENNAYSEKEYLRTIGDDEDVLKFGNEYLRLKFANGLFGIAVIESKSLH